MDEEARAALRAIDDSLFYLRRRLSILFALLIGLTALLFVFVTGPIMVAVKGHVLSQAPPSVEVIQWAPTEFVIYKVKLSLVIALLALGPLIGFYVWKGVKETRDIDLKMSRGKAGLVLGAGLLLFVLGAVYAYLLMMPIMMRFLVALTPADFAITFRIASFYNFVVLLTLAFGLVFELPLALNVAVRSGLVSYRTLASHRREAYVGIIIVGAVLTPPDIVSQSVMAAPLILFYEFGLLTVRLTGAASPKEVPG